MMIEESPTLSRSGGRRLILVVEDEELLLDVLAEELADAGYDVVRAETGEAAVQHLADLGERLDLLITDIRLPGLIDGWRVAEEGRRRLPRLPVIYVTGYANSVPRSVEGSLLITKPYRPSVIIQAVRRLGVS